jgi:hypothetical protein
VATRLLVRPNVLINRFMANRDTLLFPKPARYLLWTPFFDDF